MLISKSFLDKIVINLVFVIASFPILPYAIRSIVTITLIGITLFSAFYYSSNKKNNRVKLLFISIIPFLALVTSILYSTNKEVAIEDIIQMISLLVFPLIFFQNSSIFKERDIRTIKLVFISSVVILVFYQIISSLIQLDFLLAKASPSELKANGLLNVESINVNELKTIKLRRFRKFNSELVDTHPTYQALWIVFSVFLLIKESVKRRLVFKVFSFIVSVSLIFWLFLISSRMPIIAAIISGVIITLISSLNLKKRILITTMFFSLCIISYFSIESVKVRVDEVFKTGLTTLKKEDKVRNFNSTNVRNGINFCSFKLAKENYLYGVGVGDVQELLTDCLVINVNSKIYSWREFNTHNQYAYFLLTTGIFGVFVFFISLFIPLRISFKNKDFTYVYFLVVVSIVFLTENLLARNDGVIFYSFFNALFLFVSFKKEEKVKKIIIVGTRRSGSTFIGKLLSASANIFSYVEEPLNPVRGIKSLNHVWYPYLSKSSKSDEIGKDLNKLMNLKPVSFKSSIINIKTGESFLNVKRINVFFEIFKNKSKEKFTRRTLRFFLDSNHRTSYLKVAYFPKKNVVFKDVLMSLVLEKLYSIDKEIDVIFIFRNPIGFYYSIDRLKWVISTDNFLNQVELVKHYPFIKDLPKSTTIDKIINEWIIVNYIVLEELKKNRKIICISHEKLSLDPHGQIELIFQKAKINAQINTENITLYTQGSHKTMKTKDVKRNSIKEINNWQGEVDEATIAYIKKRTNKLYDELKKYAI